MNQERKPKKLMNWTPADIPSQKNRIAIVTGASAGIGAETARLLAQKGADVIMAVRNIEKGGTVADAIRSEHPDAKLHVMELDLSVIDSIRAFATAYLASYDQLDLLINNAGVYSNGKDAKTTADGFALVMGVNHLGHYALTGLVLDRLLSTPSSRVVTVSSGAHGGGKINLDTFHTVEAGERNAYGDSKLANILFTLELQRKFELINAMTISVAAGPGTTKSDAVQNLIQSQKNRFMRIAADTLTNIVMESPEMGAMPSLRAATDPQVKGGDYYAPGGFMGVRGYPKSKKPAKSTDNEALAQGLWDRSAELTGVDFALIKPSGG
jgi:NAD(P)-dependent dehydrogenase (short-subunit alcohol dehydrogenase family)